MRPYQAAISQQEYYTERDQASADIQRHLLKLGVDQALVNGVRCDYYHKTQLGFTMRFTDLNPGGVPNRTWLQCEVTRTDDHAKDIELAALKLLALS